jgi:hypothetical protein
MWARSARWTCGVEISDIPRVLVGLDPSYAVESWLDCSEWVSDSFDVGYIALQRLLHRPLRSGRLVYESW